MSAKTHTRPLVIATTVLVGGIAASIAGNLQAINLDNEAPGIGAYISAVFWPLALFLLIEVMLHTPWVDSKRDALTKWAGLGGMAFVALYISYGHLVHVLQAYGYDTVASHIGPLAVDGAMAMAALAINRIGQARRGPIEIPAPAAIIPASVPAAPEVTLADEIGAEARTWLDTLDEAVLDSSTTAAFPVSPAPMSNTVKPESIPTEAVAALQAWTTADPATRPTAKDRNEILSAEHGVSTRTIRRWAAALDGASAE